MKGGTQKLTERELIKNSDLEFYSQQGTSRSVKINQSQPSNNRRSSERVKIHRRSR